MAAYRHLARWERAALWICGLGLLAAAALTEPINRRDKQKADDREERSDDVVVRIKPDDPAPSDQENGLAPSAKLFKL